MARWIKVYDGILDWGWHTKPEMVSLFIHLLIKANVKDGYFLGIKVSRGQFVTSRAELSKLTGISERTIRTCLSHLELTGEITIKSTNKYTIITICKYDSYQQGNLESDQQPTSNRPATDQQPTTSIDRKNKDNIPPLLSKESIPPLKTKTMKERAKEFGQQLIPYVEVYGKEMIRDFYDYWTGYDEGDTKLAFEKAKARSKSGTFNIARRLATWKKNNDNDAAEAQAHEQPKRYAKGSSIMEVLQATGVIQPATTNNLLTK